MALAWSFPECTSSDRGTIVFVLPLLEEGARKKEDEELAVEGVPGWFVSLLLYFPRAVVIVVVVFAFRFDLEALGFAFLEAEFFLVVDPLVVLDLDLDACFCLL